MVSLSDEGLVERLVELGWITLHERFEVAKDQVSYAQHHEPASHPARASPCFLREE
jgi:hypothetical protein